MFYLYGQSGPLFAGPLEQLRGHPGARPVTPVAHLSPVTRERDAPPRGADDPAGDTTRAQAARSAYEETAGRESRRRVQRADQLMTHAVEVLPVEGRLADAWALFLRHGIGQAPVVDAQGCLVGLLARATLMRPRWSGVLGTDTRTPLADLDRPLREAMWTPVPSCAPHTDVRRVAELLLATGLPGVPVTDGDGQVLGFVSRSDLLRAMVAEPPLDLWT